MSQPEFKPRHSAAGTAALLILGLLVLIPSGLCTGILGGGALIGAFEDPKNADSALSFLLMPLIIGGPFVVGGGAMVWVAIKRMRGR
ncbi:MAG TPA: hypothetical protein VII56_17065 [Rhizomicrobium sp.]